MNTTHEKIGKRRSRVYMGQPVLRIKLHAHWIDAEIWTTNVGIALLDRREAVNLEFQLIAVRVGVIHMLSKYGAGREKDLLFNRALAGTNVVSEEILVARLKDVRCDDRLHELIRARIAADFK